MVDNEVLGIAIATCHEGVAMRAGELMTKDVVAVSPETPAREIARVLLAHGISAAPVVDGNGKPIGMVSEGDLIEGDETSRQARRDWWLMLLAEGEALHPDFTRPCGIRPGPRERSCLRRS
jgi:CBS-domain-containing membrane protein